MKRRSLAKLLILNLLTLGFFQQKWLYDTRNEMVNKFGIQVPAFRIALWVQAFNILSLSVVLIALFAGVPRLNSKIASAPNIPVPSFQCQYDYASNQPVPQGCKKTITAYYDKTSPKQRYQNYLAYLLIGIMALIIINVLSGLVIARWLKYYAAGVNTLTHGSISQARARNYLTLLPYGLGTIILQKAFNSIHLS